jgi:hypothetical protein
MTITLEFSPELEARLIMQARARGIEVAAYVRTLIEQAIALQARSRLTFDEFRAALDALAEGSEKLPALPSEAFTRESIYHHHD